MPIYQEIATTSCCEAQECFCADLIEHVLETEGSAYLKTPDDELSFLVRNSLDLHASVGAFVALAVALSWKMSRVSARYVMGGLESIGLPSFRQRTYGDKTKRL